MDIIKSNIEISYLFKNGKRFNSPYFTLIVSSEQKQHGQHGRAAFVAGKRNGNAVWRNRAKRRMRALCRSSCGPYEGYDVVFVAKKAINDASFDDLQTALVKTLKKASIR